MNGVTRKPAGRRSRSRSGPRWRDRSRRLLGQGRVLHELEEAVAAEQVALEERGHQVDRDEEHGRDQDDGARLALSRRNEPSRRSLNIIGCSGSGPVRADPAFGSGG